MKLRYRSSPSEFATHKVCANLLEGSNYTAERFGFRRYKAGFRSACTLTKKLTSKTSPKNLVATHYSPVNQTFLAVNEDGYIYVWNVAASRSYTRGYLAEGDVAFADEVEGDETASYAFAGSRRLRFDGSSLTFSDITISPYCAAFHCGRLFYRESEYPRRICWSAYGADDWTKGIDGSGYFTVGGAGGDVTDLVEYGEKLIAVRERGLTVIRAYGDPENFKVDASASYLTARSIVRGTAAICAGELYFCDEGGIYRFDGDDIEKVALSDGDEISDFVCASARGDRYYIVCKTKNRDYALGYVYDASEKSGYFIDMQISLMQAGGDEVHVFADSCTYLLTEDAGGTGEWLSKDIDLGISGNKLLKKVVFEGDGEFSLTVTADGLSRTTEDFGVWDIGMSGRTFTFSFSGSGTVERLYCEWEIRNGL